MRAVQLDGTEGPSAYICENGWAAVKLRRNREMLGKVKRPASFDAGRFEFEDSGYAFMLTDSCALSAFSSFLRREALLR